MDENSLFKELCFCILTANFNAKRGWEIQSKIGDGFLEFSAGRLEKVLRSLGYRFPKIRSEYIVESTFLSLWIGQSEKAKEK